MPSKITKCACGCDKVVETKTVISGVTCCRCHQQFDDDCCKEVKTCPAVDHPEDFEEDWGHHLCEACQWETREDDICDHCFKEMPVAYPSGGDDRICETCYKHYCRPREPYESQEDYECRHPHK